MIEHICKNMLPQPCGGFMDGHKQAISLK